MKDIQYILENFNIQFNSILKCFETGSAYNCCLNYIGSSIDYLIDSVPKLKDIGLMMIDRIDSMRGLEGIYNKDELYDALCMIRNDYYKFIKKEI